jgi:hypothetical protein
MADVQDEVLSVLSRRARFVPELARLVHAEEPELESALRELEADGAVLVREQYCADPHMVGTDLRIAARVPEPADGGDPLAAAIAQIEGTWQRWLGDYLANHRCS